ncbi:phosphotransferase [Streptomyces eurythermus]|uniref:phosphotransferase n=1 Tax=Streptomyces eurythermus TaxID=42237 RepID=UPI0036D30FA4
MGTRLGTGSERKCARSAFERIRGSRTRRSSPGQGRLRGPHAALPAAISVVKDLYTLLDSEYTGPEAVLHGDPCPDNLLLAGASVSAVVDFGTFTRTGDPLHDVACIYYRQDETDRRTAWRRLLDQAADRTPPRRPPSPPHRLPDGAPAA